MPVRDHVGAARHVAVDIQPELAVVGRKLRLGIPADGLGVGLRDEVVGAFQRPAQVPGEADRQAVQLVLNGVIGVHGGDVEVLGDLVFVDVGARAADEVVGDELLRSLVFADDRRLPAEEVRRQLLLIAFPLELVAGIQNAVARRQLVPVVDQLPPVGEPPEPVQLGRGLEFILQILDEAELHVGAGGAIGAGLVVGLIADDCRMILEVREDLPDHPLGVEQVRGVRDVHVLPGPIRCLPPAQVRHQDLGVLAVEPGRNRVGRRAENHLDAGPVEPVEDALHPGELEHPVARLPARPGGFAEPDHGKAGLLHQPDVVVEPLVGHVLVVVGRAVEDGVDLRRPAESQKRKRQQREHSCRHGGASKTYRILQVLQVD